MKSSIGSLSVVLPAYNEAEVIGETLEKVAEYLEEGVEDWEVIVVNDGSRDDTAAIVKSRQNEVSKIKLVDHGVNKGYGEALRTGFNVAEKDWVLLMDSDGQFKIESLEDLIPYITSHNVIVGYRDNRADSSVRASFTWGYNLLIKILFGLVVRDVGCAFKLFKRETWLAIQPIKSKDHKIFSVEWLWRLQKAGVNIKEMPVRHYQRSGGKATGARLDVVVAMVREMISLRWRG